MELPLSQPFPSLNFRGQFVIPMKKFPVFFCRFVVVKIEGVMDVQWINEFPSPFSYFLMVSLQPILPFLWYFGDFLSSVFFRWMGEDS